MDKYQFYLEVPYINKFFGKTKTGVYVPRDCDVCKAPLMLSVHNVVCVTQHPVKAADHINLANFFKTNKLLQDEISNLLDSYKMKDILDQDPTGDNLERTANRTGYNPKPPKIPNWENKSVLWENYRYTSNCGMTQHHLPRQHSS